MRWTSSLIQAPGGGGCSRNEDSNQLDSSSMIEAGEGCYSGPLRASCYLACHPLPCEAMHTLLYLRLPSIPSSPSASIACLLLPCDVFRALCYLACLSLPLARTRKHCRLARSRRMSTLTHALWRRCSSVCLYRW